MQSTAAPGECDLAGKVAVVTGAGRGIGRACAIHLAACGARVVVASRTQAQLDSVVAEIREHGGVATAVTADVTDYTACEAVVGVAETLGGLDVLINNAGTGAPRTVLDSDPAEWAHVVALNLIGSFNMTRAALPRMTAGGGGRIVMIGSGLGHNAVAGQSAYGASKAGLSQLVKVLAEEVWSLGIEVNEVIPGPVITTLTEELVTVGEAPPGLPSERVKCPEEVAELVGWLVTQRAGGPTGQVFSLARRPL